MWNWQGFQGPWMGQDTGMNPEMMQGQGMMPSQMPDSYGQYGNPGSVRVTKQDLVTYITQNLGASEIVKCDEFETLMTRHICPGTKKVILLKSDTFNVPTPNGLVPVRVIFCQNCRKLWIDKNTLDFM